MSYDANGNLLNLVRADVDNLTYSYSALSNKLTSHYPKSGWFGNPRLYRAFPVSQQCALWDWQRRREIFASEWLWIFSQRSFGQCAGGVWVKRHQPIHGLWSVGIIFVGWTKWRQPYESRQVQWQRGHQRIGLRRTVLWCSYWALGGSWFIGRNQSTHQSLCVW